jgi:hypothetical protein
LCDDHRITVNERDCLYPIIGTPTTYGANPSECLRAKCL